MPSAPFAIPFRSEDRALARLVQTFQDRLNSALFLERHYVIDVPGQKRHGYGPDNYAKANTTTFQSNYVCGEVGGTALTTAAPAVNTFIAVPFVAATPYPIDQIAFEVTTVSGANGKARIGIYRSTTSQNGAFYPGDLMVQAADTAVSGSTGIKTTTTTGLSLVEGDLYFAAYLCGTAAPTIRAVPVAAAWPSMGLPSTFGATPQLAYTVASTYSASVGLPSTFPSGATAHTSAIPAIALRFTSPSTFSRNLAVVSPGVCRLQRARILSSADVAQQTTGPYFTLAAAVRRGSSASILGTFDSRVNRIDAGIPWKLTGAKALERDLLEDDLLEVQVLQSGKPLADISDLRVQFTTSYAGG